MLQEYMRNFFLFTCSCKFFTHPSIRFHKTFLVSKLAQCYHQKKAISVSVQNCPRYSRGETFL